MNQIPSTKPTGYFRNYDNESPEEQKAMTDYIERNKKAVKALGRIEEWERYCKIYDKEWKTKTSYKAKPQVNQMAPQHHKGQVHVTGLVPNSQVQIEKTGFF